MQIIEQASSDQIIQGLQIILIQMIHDYICSKYSCLPEGYDLQF